MKKILILNGSPVKDGNVSTILKEVMKGALDANNTVELINLYDLNIKPCAGCMTCRTAGKCCLKEDDGHRVGRKIDKADFLVVGTPTYWGNMSSQLKILFERNVPIFMGEKPNGFPVPEQRGKSGLIVVSCSTPWPLSYMLNQSQGAFKAVKEVMKYGGYKPIGKIIRSGAKNQDTVPPKILEKALKIGKSL